MKNNWITKIIDLGTIPKNSVQNFYFEYTGDNYISSINEGCSSCTNVSLDTVLKRLNVTFKVPSFSLYFKNNINPKFTSKSIYIFYQNGEQDVLTFKANVV